MDLQLALVLPDGKREEITLTDQTQLKVGPIECVAFWN